MGLVLEDEPSLTMSYMSLKVIPILKMLQIVSRFLEGHLGGDTVIQKV